MVLSIFEIPVGVRWHGDAIIARVTVDGEYRYGEFCSVLGLITWVQYNRRTLLHNKRKTWHEKDESISEIVRRITEMLNEDESIQFEERLAA